MKIAIRMDDITPDMDWERFGAVRALLEEFKVKPLIGVVPDNRDDNLNRMGKGAHGEGKPEDFWLFVKELEKDGWVIALHGFRHRYTEKRGGMFPLNHFSEFAGLTYEKQYAMIESGKKLLRSHGITTDIFMAPAHSYDRNTLKALRDNGFLRITDGFGRKPYRMKGLTFYPIAFRLENSLKRKSGITTLVIHSNTVTEKDMERYRRILETGDAISYGEYLETPAGKRGVPGHAAEYAAAVLKHMLVRFL